MAFLARVCAYIAENSLLQALEALEDLRKRNYFKRWKEAHRIAGRPRTVSKVMLRMGRCGRVRNAPNRRHSWCGALLARYARCCPGCCRNQIFPLSCSLPESSLQGRVGASDVQSPLHKARGFPRRRKEERLLGSPVT